MRQKENAFSETPENSPDRETEVMSSAADRISSKIAQGLAWDSSSLRQKIKLLSVYMEQQDEEEE